MAQNTDKSHPQKKGTKKTSKTIARFVLCQRCTNCFRRSWTTDFIPDWSNSMGGSSSYQAMDHSATYRMIEQKCHEWESKCGLRQQTARRRLIPSPTTLYGTPSKLVVSNNTKKQQYWLKKRVTCSRSKRGPSRATRYRACSSTLFCRWPWKMTFHAGKRKKGMGICLGDGDHDCLMNLRFADGVLLFASTKEQLQNM